MTSDHTANEDETAAQRSRNRVVTTLAVVAASVAAGTSVYLAHADDIVAKGPEADQLEIVINEALGGYRPLVSTPGKAESLAPLGATELDKKFTDVETRLREMFTGVPLDQQLFGAKNVRDAEVDGLRIVRGGSKVLSFDSLTLDGETAHAAGLNESWLDTAQPQTDGTYVVGPGYDQTHFTIDLTRKSDGGWLVTSMKQKHDVPGYRPG